MNKLYSCAAAIGLLLVLSGPASAMEFKASGSAEMVFEAAGNYGVFETGQYVFQDTGDVLHNYNETHHGKHSRAIQRFILQFDFVVSENLSAHYDVLAGFFTWGGPVTGAGLTQGGQIGTRATNIATRQAYLDWVIPNTRAKIRMGLQAWSLPSFAVGTLSPGSDEFGTGILAMVPLTDRITLTAGWIWAVSDSRRGAVALTDHRDDNIDVFLFTLPVRLDGFRFASWGAFGLHGKDAANIVRTDSYKAISTSNASDAGNTPAGYADIDARLLTAGKPGLAAVDKGTSLFLGFGGEMTRFDPWRFALDAQYSAYETRGGVRDRSGWLAGMAVDYKTAWGVPSLKAWYASGDDKNPLNGSERALSMAGRSITGSGANTLFGSGNLGGNMMLNLSGAIAGTWGMSLQWNNASFLTNLSHNLHVSYIQGTNHRSMAPYANPRFITAYLTKADSLVEINLESMYRITPNLHYVIDTAYLFENFDGRLWARGIAPGTQRTGGVDKLDFTNAWHVGMNFRYVF